jgi:predicted AlkP superfamily phosphohydrolase/phosphomutase
MKGFEYFMKANAVKEMKSTIPPVTSAAWPSIYTGKKPNEHQMMDFLHIDKNYTRQLLYYDTEEHNPFWEVLAKKGKKSLVITPPIVLQRSNSKNVDLITGWPLPPKYSSKELEEIAKRFGFDGEPDIGVDLDKKTLPLAEGTELYVKSIESRSEYAKYLIKRKDYDLVFVCFTETDRIAHYALNRKDWEKYTAPIYKSVSNFIEWVIEYSKDEENSSIMILSDHGAQPIKNKFLVNTWLIDNNYAMVKPDGKKSGKSSLTSAKKYVSEKVMKLKIRRAIYNNMPSFLKKAAEKMIDESLEESQDANHIKIQESDFEMQKTKAFAAVSYGPCGMIWINDDRFANPGTNKKETKLLKKELMNKLSMIKDPNKNKLIIDIIDGSKYYEGASKFIAPDILFQLRDNYLVDFSYLSTQGIFMKPEPYRSGDHSINGIFGWIGKRNVSLIKGKASIYDVHQDILDYFS